MQQDILLPRTTKTKEDVESIQTVGVHAGKLCKSGGLGGLTEKAVA